MCRLTAVLSTGILCGALVLYGAAGAGDSARAQRPPAAATSPIVTPESSPSFEEMVQSVPDFISEAAASSLAEAIRYSRDEAVKRAKPVPPKMREALAPYFSEHILNKVRHSCDWNASSNATLQHFLMGHDYVLAVTLDHVIVFKKESLAADLFLWAHELKHVEQYDAWGVEEFAMRYLHNANAVEEEAYNYGLSVLRDSTRKMKTGAPQSTTDQAKGTQEKNPKPVTHPHREKTQRRP